MATKNKYSYRGQDYSLLDQVPEDLVCPICHELLDEPQQTVCGHLFCKKCLTKVNQNSPTCLNTNRGVSGGLGGLGKGVLLQQLPSKQHKCAVCNTNYTETPTNDKYNDRRVSSLRTHCTHNSESCGWVGTVGQVQEHLNNTCEHHTVPCTMNCGQQVSRCLQSRIQMTVQRDKSLANIVRQA